jgi:hypothetical protein
LNAIVAMTKKGPRSRRVGQEIRRRQNRTGQQRQPGRDAVELVEPRGDIGADPEEHAMRQRELPADAADDVPGRGKPRHQICGGDDPDPVGVA